MLIVFLHQQNNKVSNAIYYLITILPKPCP